MAKKKILQNLAAQMQKGFASVAAKIEKIDAAWNATSPPLLATCLHQA